MKRFSHERIAERADNRSLSNLSAIDQLTADVSYVKREIEHHKILREARPADFLNTHVQPYLKSGWTDQRVLFFEFKGDEGHTLGDRQRSVFSQPVVSAKPTVAVPNRATLVVEAVLAGANIFLVVLALLASFVTAAIGQWAYAAAFAFWAVVLIATLLLGNIDARTQQT